MNNLCEKRDKKNPLAGCAGGLAGMMSACAGRGARGVFYTSALLRKRGSVVTMSVPVNCQYGSA